MEHLEENLIREMTLQNTWSALHIMMQLSDHVSTKTVYIAMCKHPKLPFLAELLKRQLVDHNDTECMLDAIERKNLSAIKAFLD